jgi:hypothetical protein
LCLRYHPDIAREEGAVEKFQELQEAYRVLADDGEGALDVPLPEDLEWSAHDWRWAMRYNRGNAGDDDETAGGSDRPLDDLLGATRKVEEAERKARLEAQLSAMASCADAAETARGEADRFGRPKHGGGGKVRGGGDATAVGGRGRLPERRVLDGFRG